MLDIHQIKCRYLKGYVPTIIITWVNSFSPSSVELIFSKWDVSLTSGGNLAIFSLTTASEDAEFSKSCNAWNYKLLLYSDRFFSNDS